MPTLAPDTKTHPSNGGRLVSADGRTLLLTHSRLRADAGGGIARTCLEQAFRNPYAEPLTVTYLLPLPADGAVSGFAFRIGDRRIVGEIDRRTAARERFEEAIAAGRSAALLEEERTSLFTQEIGNIPSGAEVVAEITIDQPLAWLGDSWEWRFPTAVAPRYLGTAGRVPDVDRVVVDVTTDAVPARLGCELTITDALAEGPPASPSHDVRVAAGDDAVLVSLANGRLDRDLVVRWPVAGAAVGASVAVARGTAADEAHGLLTIVPPKLVGPAVRRDLIALIDTSGSMHGEPLDQARHIVAALVRSLADGDSLELIEFSSTARGFAPQPLRIGPQSRADALRWIAGLQAGGATEMHTAISAALAATDAEAQRQVVLVTDGMIGFEQEIVAEILQRLPAASRVHTVGVGSAVNRTLTAGAARAGRGVEVLVGIGEDPEPVAQRIVARTAIPTVVDLTIDGSAVLGHAPQRLPDLFAGAPACIAVQLHPAGGTLCVRGRTADGDWQHSVDIDPIAAGAGRPALRSLFGRETVADLEMRIAAGTPCVEIDPQIEAVGLAYQLSTRLTSWIAVSDEPSVDPQQPTRRQRIPHELPHGMSVQGLGLRSAGEAEALFSLAEPAACAADPSTMRRSGGAAGGLLDALLGGGRRKARRRKQDLAPGVCRGDSVPPGDAENIEPGTMPPLRGHIALHRDGTLVIEIESPGIHWTVADRATLHFADGSTVAVEVVAERCTATGYVPPGTRMRLTLRMPAGHSGHDPHRLELPVHDFTLTIELD